MAWIESHQELERHPKVIDLMAATGWDLDTTIGKLHRFWWWCVDYAEDGDLRKHNDDRLGAAVGVSAPGEAKRFVEAMTVSGWIDREPYFRVHDWWDYVGYFLKIKYKNYPEKWEEIKKLYVKQKNGSKTTPKRMSKNELPNLPNLPNKKEKVKKEKKLADKPDDVSQQVWVDFLTHREGRRAAVTKTVIKAFTKEAEKAGINLEAALKECCSRGWQGFKAEWYLKDSQGGKYGTNKHGRKGPADAIAETFAEY